MGTEIKELPQTKPISTPTQSQIYSHQKPATTPKPTQYQSSTVTPAKSEPQKMSIFKAKLEHIGISPNEALKMVPDTNISGKFDN